MDKGFKFSGILKAEINAPLLEASLILEKSPGENWDSERLTKHLMTMGIKEGFKKTDIDYQIDKFVQSKEKSLQFVFAKGILPLPPVAEEVEWDDFLIPEDMKNIADRILKKNPNPAVFDVKKEKIEIKKQVEVKGGLFAGKKVETQITNEIREVREHVIVSAQSLAVGFFEAGQKIGTSFPSKPGKPGRDLGGRLVPPPQVPSGKFFLGEGIEKSKDGYKVLVSGFVRRGKNWVEVLEYLPHQFQISYSPDKSNAHLDFHPGSIEAPIVDSAEILKKLESDGFPIERVLSKGDIDAVIRKSLQSQIAVTGFSLTSTSDGRSEINISTDKLKAAMTLYKPTGKGAPLNLTTLVKEISALTIKNLVIGEVMKTVNAFMASDKILLQDFIFAQGKSPTRNPDRILDFRVNFLTHDALKIIHQRIKANPLFLKETPGLMEFPLEQVQKGAVVNAEGTVAVLNLGNGVPGVTGVDIFGEIVPPFPGNDPRLFCFGEIRRVGDSVLAFEDGFVEIKEDETGYYLRLRKHKDALVEVFHSNDHMSARMNLYQALGTGSPLTTTQIEETLKQEQVLDGIDHEAIVKALDLARKSGKVESVLVASGKAPGSDLRARIFFKTENRHDLKKDITQGSATAGTVIAEYDPHDGTCADGVDIMGNIIPCAVESVQELKLEAGFSTKPLEDSTRVQILAERSGEFLFDGKTLQLKDTLVLPHGAKKSEGNRKFAGNVAVETSVESGVALYAGGDLKINGDVGASLLSGGINVIVSGLVRGEGKAVISAKKHISVHQAERTILMSVGDTVIQHSALFCTFKCNGRIRQSKAEGTIAGGNIRTKFGMEVHNLGHPSKKETIVSFGQDYLVEDQIKTEEKEVDKIRQSIIALDRMMLKFSKPDQKAHLDAVRKKKVLLMKMLEKRGRKLIFLRDKFEVHFPSEILVKGSIFPGVNIESHGRLLEVQQKKTSVRITFNLMTGKLEETPL